MCTHQLDTFYYCQHAPWRDNQLFDESALKLHRHFYASTSVHSDLHDFVLTGRNIIPNKKFCFGFAKAKTKLCRPACNVRLTTNTASTQLQSVPDLMENAFVRCCVDEETQMFTNAAPNIPRMETSVWDSTLTFIRLVDTAKGRRV